MLRSLKSKITSKQLQTNLNFSVHNPAVEYTFQVTKPVKLNIKRLSVKPLSTISEQTATLCVCIWMRG